MSDPLADLVADPALASEAAAARAEWRAEEEEWTRAEAERWRHQRTLAGLAREYLHRGDTVEVVAAGVRFRGPLSRVGDDWLQVQTDGGPVDVSFSSALVLRRLVRAAAGGCRDDGAVATFRARLLEYEAGGEAVIVGAPALDGALRGVLTVGSDHVIITTDEIETALPEISWVQRAVSEIR
jgi:hypothetical protein